LVKFRAVTLPENEARRVAQNMCFTQKGERKSNRKIRKKLLVHNDYIDDQNEELNV